MPLKQDEANKLVYKCKMLWNNPFKITSSTAFEWAQAAGDLNHDEIDRALDSFAEQGDKFPPSVAELMSRAKGYRTSRKRTLVAAVCSYCGGPFWSGPVGQEQIKHHYSWCHLTASDERGAFVQHPIHVDAVDSDEHCPPVQPANVQAVPMPPEVRTRLKLITNDR